MKNEIWKRKICETCERIFDEEITTEVRKKKSNHKFTRICKKGKTGARTI